MLTEAVAKAEDAQNALSVVESAGYVVAKVAKAEAARNELSDVEFQPELKVADRGSCQGGGCTECAFCC